jgi:hypothetical protein
MRNAEKSDPRKRGGRIHLREIEFAAVRAEDAASLVTGSGDHTLTKQMRRVFAGGQDLEGMRACMERWDAQNESGEKRNWQPERSESHRVTPPGKLLQEWTCEVRTALSGRAPVL